MSKAKQTQIFMVIDRSGSMVSNQVEVEGGINHFIKEQSKLPGKCQIHLYDFDTIYRKVFSAPADQAPEYKLVPRGMTALYDAIGKTIVDAKKIAKKDDLIILVIATDGQENHSQEYKGIAGAALVKDMIAKREKKGWQITFLAAGLDAFAEGNTLGIDSKKHMQFDKAKAGATYGAVSQAVGRSRMAHNAGKSADLEYTDAERNSAV